MATSVSSKAGTITEAGARERSPGAGPCPFLRAPLVLWETDVLIKVLSDDWGIYLNTGDEGPAGANQTPHHRDAGQSVAEHRRQGQIVYPHGSGLSRPY